MNSNFEKGGKFYWLHSTVDAFETFLHVPGTVTKKGSHVRDAIDLKRLLILVVIAAVPAALFGMWNVGYQHGLAIGDSSLNILGNFWYGFLRVLPLYLVSYIVGLGIEFASSQIRGEEVSEGYLVSGFFIPLIVPVDIPLWMLGVAVAFAVIFGKEVFGGTGMNIVNPAILTRAFLFFSYPNYMSGSDCWIHYKPTPSVRLPSSPSCSAPPSCSGPASPAGRSCAPACLAPCSWVASETLPASPRSPATCSSSTAASPSVSSSWRPTR